MPAARPESTSPVPPTVIDGVFFGFVYVVSPSEIISVAPFKIITTLCSAAVHNSLLLLIPLDSRLLLDASALVPEVLPEISGKNCILSPHAGEYKRLFGHAVPDDDASRESEVEKMAAEHKVVIILKGATDIISDGETTYTNPKKTPSMTVGGTGDVLSGLAAGMLAKNRNALQAASAAVFVNGLAGAAAQEKFGLHILATDVCDNIPYVMKSFDRIGDNA